MSSARGTLVGDDAGMLRGAIRRRVAAVLPTSFKHRVRQTTALGRLKLRARPFTVEMVDRYCRGRGLEIGPGLAPMSPADRTVMLDRFPARLGHSILSDVVGDGSALPFKDAAVDYLVSAHMLEHHHDPLLVLKEWARVLRNGGTLLLVLPHVDRTFDRGRPTSTLDDLEAVHGDGRERFVNWADFERYSLSVAHPWAAEPGARSSDGTWNRQWIADQGYIHYHAWTQDEMVEIVRALGFRVLLAAEELPDRSDSFVVVASKSGPVPDPAPN